MITSINDISLAYNAVWLGINSYNVSALLRGRKGDTGVSSEELEQFKEANKEKLPKISVLLPAYHEEGVLRESIKALELSNYPKKLFEVLVLLEKDDIGTRAVAEDLSRQFHNVKPVVVEADVPGKGKPRALNYGLERSNGSLVGVVDAEDIVSPNMLLESAYLIQERGYDAVQGRLDMTNDKDGWKNLMLRAEYGYWFNYYLKAISNADYPLPFGGTTNFFKRELLQKLGGWDQNSLTEDFELGLRIYNSNTHVAVSERSTDKKKLEMPEPRITKKRAYTKEFYIRKSDYYGSTRVDLKNSEGKDANAAAQRLNPKVNRVGMMRSVTREESPLTNKAWIRQRTRWDQGKIQAMRKNVKNPPDGTVKKFHTYLTTLQPHLAAINVTGIIVGVYAYATNALDETVKIFAGFNIAMLGFYAAMNGIGYLAATKSEKEHIRFRRAKALVAAVTTPAYWVLQWVADFNAMKLEYLDKSSAWAKTEHKGRHFNATNEAMDNAMNLNAIPQDGAAPSEEENKD
ncbi:MAG: glycosyltransferase [Candidatus Marsarchaeota archaeon]|nr:glycosyltransferase [Candidatus Marsarchaeota archaeon]MCL5101892.1 glycosyltransferase [Candidatus Marsarchaeota archaeon]